MVVNGGYTNQPVSGGQPRHGPIEVLSRQAMQVPRRVAVVRKYLGHTLYKVGPTSYNMVERAI